MAPSLSSSKIKLSYPLYAAHFDPSNPDFLLVGGGGGSSSTGVPNKISLLDTSHRDHLAEVVDIELAKDEDSVTSLAVVSSSDTTLLAFAGINSSVADQAAGKNEHLRSFHLGLPPRKRRADGSAVDTGSEKPLPQTKALGRTALFQPPKGPKSEAYQRILRVSTPIRDGQPRLAAIASGLAPANEIVTFRPGAAPKAEDKVSHIHLGAREAADLDIVIDEDDEKSSHVLAYCTDDEVFLQQLSTSSKPDTPRSLYKISDAMPALPSSKRPKFRALRFLTPRHILLLQNRPGRTGADLLVLRVSTDCAQAQVSLRKRLHTSTKAAVGLDVAVLNESDHGEKQIAIAVAGQAGDASSIEILTLDYSPASGLGTFRPYTFLPGLHSGPLTGLAFSLFVDPKDAGPASLRLASVGIDQFVVVHRLPLRPFPATSKTPRYVLTPPGRSEAMQTTFSLFFALVVVGLCAFLMQAFCEIRGAVPPTLGAPDWLSPRLRDLVVRPYIFADGLPRAADIPIAASSATSHLRDAASAVSVSVASAVTPLVDTLKDLVAENTNRDNPGAIVLREDGPAGEISTEILHGDSAAVVVDDSTLKRWDELSDAQKRSWKDKLVHAGQWAEKQGEGILKGILFSELAAIVAG